MQCSSLVPLGKRSSVQPEVVVAAHYACEVIQRRRSSLVFLFEDMFHQLEGLGRAIWCASSELDYALVRLREVVVERGGEPVE